MREVAGAKHRTEGEKTSLSAPLECSGAQPSPPVSFADSPLSRWGQGLHEQLHLSFDKLHQNYDLSQDLKISLLLNSSAPIVPFDENLFPSFLRYNALHRLIPLLILLLHNKNQQYNLLLLFAFENELYISAKNNTKAFAPTESYYFSTLWPIRYCFFDKVSLKSLCLNHVEILIEPLALPPCLPLMREVAGAKHRTEGEKTILSAPLECSGAQPSPPVSFADSPLSRWGQADEVRSAALPPSDDGSTTQALLSSA